MSVSNLQYQTNTDKVQSVYMPLLYGKQVVLSGNALLQLN